jgi:iron complex transport system permease protein
VSSSKIVKISLLLFLSLGLCFINLTLGPVDISWSELHEPLQKMILLELRIPKVLMAIFAGGLLSLSGLFMQTYFQNPLVGPYILGVHSGASFGVALWYLFGGVTIGLFGLVGLSMMGALLVLALLVFVAPFFQHKSFLLIFGLVLGQMLSGILSLITLYAPSEILRGFLVWGMGSFERMSIEHALLLSGCGFLFFMISMLLVKPLNALLLGESYAQSLGIRLKSLKLQLILLSGLMTAMISASCGPIAFVGVLAPHMARAYWGELRHQWLIPTAFLMGAFLCLLVQAIGLLLMPYNLPVNMLLALVSAPAFFFFLLRLKGRRHAF